MENFLKKGDVVCDFEGSVWGSQRFVVNTFFGGNYWKMVNCYKMTEPHTLKNMVNLVQSNVRIIDARNRPFRNIETRRLIFFIRKGVLEAKRELKIRNNIKRIKNGK